jgi:glycine oxidase
VLTFHAKPEMPPEFEKLRRLSADLYSGTIEELAEVTGDRVRYGTGGELVVALTKADLTEVESLYAVNSELGIQVERATPEECRLLEPSVNPDICGAVFFPDDRWVDNTALTFAMVEAAETAGADFVRATVDAVERAAGRATGVRCTGETYSADWIIVAAGCWSGQIEGIPQLHVAPVRGQALTVAGQSIRRVVTSPRGYVVPKGDGQTMVGATVEFVGFDDSNTLGGLGEISKIGHEIAPALSTAEFLGAWAGLRPGTPDNMPFIGPFGELPNLIAATGHFRNGILLAPSTASLVTAMIKEETPLLDFRPFLPDRATNL